MDTKKSSCVIVWTLNTQPSVVNQTMAECRGVDFPSLASQFSQTRRSLRESQAPLARKHALFSTEGACARPPGSLVRVTFQIGPRGRTCTCNLSGLSGTPLHWVTRGWCPRTDLHRHCARFKCAVSALDYVGYWRRATKLVPREGFPPPTFPI